MSDLPGTQGTGGAMTQPFPKPGRLIGLAYRELRIASEGTAEQIGALGDPRTLPRPWDPPTCTNRELRLELWDWLDRVATWVNHEYTWDIVGTIPACWPQHPHLVHEIAALADQRHSAGNALTGGPLDQWHRYTLSSFTERMRTRLKDHCEEGHQPWPARSRHARHTDALRHRAARYGEDIETVGTHGAGTVSQLSIVNLETGEIDDG